MSKPELRVGVLTLSPGDELQLEPGALSKQLQNLVRQGLVTYTTAPDDWAPFGDGKTILDHLKGGLNAFQLFSDSSDVANLTTRLKIKLFVIDPTILLHPEKAKLATLVQEHICARPDTASCLVICGSLPSQFVNDLSDHYRIKLKDLVDHADVSVFEYQVDSVRRLKQFLARITPWLGDVPIPPRIAEALKITAALAGRTLPPMAAPTIGMGGR